jgi:hypothetical protein
METPLTLLVCAIMALTAIIAGLWLARIRATRRLRAVADAYAEREIARQARWQARKAG